MLDINFEFRKGIFFIRLLGDLNSETYKNNAPYLESLLTDNQFKYIVLNTNYLNTIDLAGINYLTKVMLKTKNNNTDLIICDKTNLFKTLLNSNIPSISDELEVL